MEKFADHCNNVNIQEALKRIFKLVFQVSSRKNILKLHAVLTP